MGLNSFLKSPKKEEQQVPDNNVVSDHFNDTKNVGNFADEEVDIMDDLERILGINEDEVKLTKSNVVGHLNWEFADWDEFRNGEDQEDGEEEEEEERELKMFDKEITKCFFEEEEEGYYDNSISNDIIKKEHVVGFWDDDYQRVSLNLNLNYQEVLDAWSDRGSLWADDYSLSMAANGYMGEVPVMEEEKTRREASVLRYKEKRQTRLFSKKIRYQVRKLNADKRPRLKGRFVKRVS